MATDNNNHNDILIAVIITVVHLFDKLNAKH